MAIIKNPAIIVKVSGQSTSNLYKVLDENNTTLTAQDLEGVTEIGNNIDLGGGTYLESVTLPDTVTYIGHNAIAGDSVQYITVTSSVLPTIENDSFGQIDSILVTIYVPDDADWGDSSEKWMALAEYDRIVEYSRE